MTQAVMTWSRVTGATSYNTYRSTVMGATGTALGSTTLLSYSDTTFSFDVPYWYGVTAVNNTGEGPLSTQFQLTLPSPPSTPAPTITNFAVTPASLPFGGGAVTLSATATNATSTTIDGVSHALPFSTSASTSHTYTLVAHGPTSPDATAQTSVFVATGATGATGTNDADFQARISQPGVVRYFTFDNNAQLGTQGAGANFGNFSNSNTASSLPVIDNSVYCSGSGSLRFDIPSQSFPDGQWYGNFSSDLSVRFGQNTKFYIQWRQRFDTNFCTVEYLDADGVSPQGGIKQFIVGPGDTAIAKWGSCEAIHCVTQTYYQHRFPIGYNSCTGTATRGPYAGFYTGDGDPELQNGTAPYCTYSSTHSGSPVAIPSGCIGWFANEWMTFQVEITLGARNDALQEFTNSTYRLWVAREGQASQLVINWVPTVSGYFQLAAGPANQDQQFGKVWLLPYMTTKSPTQVTPAAQTWYDELIISRQPINDPIVGTPPPGAGSGSGGGGGGTGNYPTWRQGHAVDQWFDIPNTASMNGINGYYVNLVPPTGQTAGIIDVWNGFAGSNDSLYSALGGGDGYWVNGVFKLDLSANAPQWVQLHASTTYANTNLTLPYYNDGTPVARHTYYSQQYIPATQDKTGHARVMVFSDFAAYGVFAGGQFAGGPQVDGFRLDNATWDAGGTWQNVPFQASAPMSIVKDTSTGNVYIAGGYQFAKWTASTGQALTFAPTGSTTLLAWDNFPSLYDVKRKHLVCIHDGRPYYNPGVVRMQVIDVVANTFSDILVTGALTMDIAQVGGGLVHDTDNDRYLFFWAAANGSMNVWNINPTTGAAVLLNNTGTTAVHSMYGRAWYISDLGGVAYLARYSGAIQFMPTRNN